MVGPVNRRTLILVAVLAGVAIVYAAVQTFAVFGESDGGRWRRVRLAQIKANIDKLQGLAAAEIEDLGQTPERHLLFDAVANCITEERIGTRGDGGKWLCNGYKLRPHCIVYGVGAGHEISFETEMASRFGCDVHLFDPSPEPRRLFADMEKGKRFGPGSVTFHPWGLGPVSEDPAHARDLVIEGARCEVKTLDELAAALSHDHIDVLKMDVEGSERAIIPDLLGRRLLQRFRIKQLLVEVHTGEASDYVALVRLHGELLRAGYPVFRKEINPRYPGTCAEYAFAEIPFLLD